MTQELIQTTIQAFVLGGVGVIIFRAGRVVQIVDDMKNNHLPHIKKQIDRLFKKVEALEGRDTH